MPADLVGKATRLKAAQLGVQMLAGARDVFSSPKFCAFPCGQSSWVGKCEKG